MRARWLLNLALLALVAILVAVVIYQPGRKPAVKPPRLTTLKRDAVTHIHITRPGDKAVTLVKKDGRWRMTAPYTLPANATRIDGLLRLCSTQSHRSFPYKPADAAEYGLNHPRAAVRLNDTEIAFGGSQPVSHERYVRIGKRIHLITDSMTYYLLSRATAFVNLSPLAQGDLPVGFELPGLSLNRKDSHWHAKPRGVLHSADQVATLIQYWHDAQAIEIRTYPANKRKAHPARVVLELSGKKPPLRFDIVSKKPEFILGRRDAGIEYVLPAGAAARLLQLKQPAPKASAHEKSAEKSPAKSTATPTAHR